MFNLMRNYGIFTQICVLHDLLQKKQKEQQKQQIWPKTRKAVDWAKVGKVECRDNFHQFRNKT